MTRFFSARAFSIFSLLCRRLIFCLRRRLNRALSPLIEDITLTPSLGPSNYINAVRLQFLSSAKVSACELSMSQKMLQIDHKKWRFRNSYSNLCGNCLKTSTGFDASFAFPGNFSIAKAQRAGQGVFEVKIFSIRCIRSTRYFAERRLPGCPSVW